MQRRASVGGDVINVELAPDDAPRTVEVPADLATTLAQDKGARAAFDALSYSNPRRHVLAVEGAKTAATRQRRITKIIEELRRS